MSLKRVGLWICSNLALYCIAITVFAIWIQREVDEEFRLGLRDGSGGDKVAIPIAGFALLLGAIMITINVIWLIVRHLRRRTTTTV